MDRNLLLTTTDVSWSLAFSLVACAVCGVNAICSIIIRLVLCTDFYPLCGPDLHHSTHYYSYLTTTATATTTTTTTTITTTRSFSGPSVNLFWDSLHLHCTEHRPLDPFLECVAGNSFNKPCWICTVLHRLCGRFSQRYSQVGYASCTTLLSFGSLLKVLRDGRTLREESTDLRKKRWIASEIDHSASALLISHFRPHRHNNREGLDRSHNHTFLEDAARTTTTKLKVIFATTPSRCMQRKGSG